MIPQHVAACLAAHGLQAIECSPGTTATAELAARQLGVQVGQIAKSLVFLICRLRPLSVFRFKMEHIFSSSVAAPRTYRYV
jgi:prolyl-tRNA editing enzyme YbaK/EbsC (Cys-tRNA(Pro) deacylase)